MLGGICSLCMIIFVMCFGILELLKVFSTPQIFHYNVTRSYLSSGSDTEIYDISTQDFIPAIQIIDYSG